MKEPEMHRFSTDVHQGRAVYHRYHIDTQPVPDLVPWPPRFNVRVSKTGLASLLIKEIFHYKGDIEAITSRPCMYGVFSGPVGGFAPRPKHCVGCLRCTTQYPEWVCIEPNPERLKLGDDYFTSNHVNAVAYEASMGAIPVKGAGYRGLFGGEGWDGMWTDMSEIVRPTRDGIHGREFISTAVDIGTRPSFMRFDSAGQPVGEIPQMFTIPIPMIFDNPADSAASSLLHKILAQTADIVETLAITPVRAILDLNLRSSQVAPLLKPAEVALLSLLPCKPKMVVMAGWDQHLFNRIKAGLPGAVICLRIPFPDGRQLLEYVNKGISVFHLTANYHGRSQDGVFIFDLIRTAHQSLVDAGIRQRITFIGSGGIIAAEHVPKAIIAGLDAVALDSPVLVALQARFEGNLLDRESGNCKLPRNLDLTWGQGRLTNLVGTWRDQLLEILGAMGLREVRRLRGEMGRAMFQKDLEQAAFAGIPGYPTT